MSAEQIQDSYTVSQIELDRRSFRRKQTTKSVFISIVSLLILATAIVLVLSNSEGWSKVQEMYFSPEHLIASFPKVFKGILMNIRILCFAVVGVALLATLVAITRTTRSAILFPLRFIANIYTDIFRGLPMIIVLYLVGFGIPGLDIFGRISAVFLGTISIIIVYSAYVSEVIRAGIEAVHPSQRAAARSLGFSHGKTMRLIILPQAIRKVVPALMNDFVAMQKDVGLVSILGVVDAVRSAGIYTAVNFNYSSYVVAGILFILMSLPFIRVTDWYTGKLRKREQMEGSV